MSKLVASSNKVQKRKKKQSHNKEVPCKTFVHKNKYCICCGEKMKRISGDERYLTTKDERIKVYAEVLSCHKSSCKLYQQRIKPPQLSNLLFPDLSYGMDLMAEIGVLRFRDNRNMSEIYEEIKGRYPHVEMTQRHMQNLVNKIMYALESAAMNPDTMKDMLLDKNEALEGLVLSIDGIQPERGNETLYIVRELQTGIILFTKFLAFSDEETIKKEIYQPLKRFSGKMGLPVLGLVADKQLALTTAFEAVFPDLPVQHCQSHFLKALRAPIQEESSQMAKMIKKTQNPGHRKKD